MKHATPRIAYAAPPTMEKRLEAMQALRALDAQDDERLRERRAEIGALRRDLETLRGDCGLLAQTLGQTCRAKVLSELQTELKKYNPNEPRVPAGRPDGGEWTTESGAGVSINPPGLQYVVNDPPGRFPPPPPGYDARTWKQGQWPNGTYW